MTPHRNGQNTISIQSIYLYQHYCSLYIFSLTCIFIGILFVERDVNYDPYTRMAKILPIHRAIIFINIIVVCAPFCSLCIFTGILFVEREMDCKCQTYNCLYLSTKCLLLTCIMSWIMLIIATIKVQCIDNIDPHLGKVGHVGHINRLPHL